MVFQYELVQSHHHPPLDPLRLPTSSVTPLRCTCINSQLPGSVLSQCCRTDPGWQGLQRLISYFRKSVLPRCVTCVVVGVLVCVCSGVCVVVGVVVVGVVVVGVLVCVIACTIVCSGYVGAILRSSF